MLILVMMMESAAQAARLVCDQVSAAAASGNMIKQHLLQTVADRDDDIDDLDNVDDRDGCERPESQKGKTFRIARFLLQKLSG